MSTDVYAQLEALIEPEPTTGCWLWKGHDDGRGYGTLYLNGQTRRAHRLMMIAVHGSIPAGAHVLHSCDQPACVNPGHLRFGSRHDNMRDCSARERHGAMKLTTAQVLEVRRRRAAGELLVPLAREYGVTKESISQITRRITWKHLP